ncbi:MAG TPA: hypothetical protein VFR24_18915 [Candidatus Angelobacter sp.]|nr:hypothetical protein [Candidatus Angelobacter sp.]
MVTRAGEDIQRPGAEVSPELQEDALVLPRVTTYLSRGIELLKWWREVESKGGPEIQFPIERSFNRPTRSFGFYGEAPVEGRMMPVMGNVQEMFYDQTRAPESLNRESAEWMWEQIREFVMKYFMRVSSFRQPEAYVDASFPIPPPALRWLSWCPNPQGDRVGFGFSQLFYKLMNNAGVYSYPSYDRFAIVDQREIGNLYEWLVLKVRIFDFSFKFRPLGNNGPELVFGENEQSYLAVHKEFVNYKDHHLPGVLGEAGIGYAFIKNPKPGPFSYGPGAFDAAVELINFRVYATGYVSVRMIFVANRPTGISNLVIDPVDWSFRVADVLSLGIASRLFGPARDLFDPLKFSIDPVTLFVNAANGLSNDYAANALCISREQLERFFLLLHFRQHYQTIVGSLLTWRQIPDWLDQENLPAWVISGVGS